MTEKKDVVDIAIESSEIQNIYFNGVGLGMGAGDVVITLVKNGSPQVVLNTSHIIAKTLAKKLIEAMEEFEQQTNTKILTTEEVHAAIGDGE